MRKTRTGWAVVGMCAVGVLGCGAENGSPGDTESAPIDAADELAALDGVLSVGAQGDSVRAVTRYLKSFGYLPNAELQRRYPRWRSPVSVAPAREDVFDDQTAESVRALQRFFRLDETGMVDAATLELMQRPRCGVPDTIEHDPTNKYDVYGGLLDWSSTNLTWRFLNSGGGVSLTRAQGAAAAAFASWQWPSRHTFTQLTSGTANIQIQFSSTPPDSFLWVNALAYAYHSDQGGDIWVNNNIAWSTSSPTPSSAHDLESLLLHEIGHSLNLDHSSFESSAMHPGLPAGQQWRSLTSDDKVGAMLKKMVWLQFDSASYDIDIDDEPGSYLHVNVTGDPPISGGFTVWRWDGEWTVLEGQGAVRLASNDGDTWIVQSDGDIYEWGGTAWHKRPGCAKDIGVGGDDSVWIIGCTPIGSNFRVYKWNGSSWDGDSNVRGGVRISVGPKVPGFAHRPWIVDASHNVWRKSTNSTSFGSWEPLPGSGTDIAVNPDGNAWLIDNTTAAGGRLLHAWNEQPALGTGATGALARFGWIHSPGIAAVNVSVDSEGFPYVVNSNKAAFWVQ